MSQAEDRRYGWLVGRVGGVPVFIGRSWPVVALIVVLTFAPSLARELSAGVAYAVSAAYALLLLVSVLVHEFGHALAARAVGAPVHRIVVNLWGGHTSFDGQDQRPGSQALLAVAGPLGNLLLAGLGWLLAGPLTGISGFLAWALWVSNAFVAVFNLLPGLPLDGGHIVSALVWRVSGDRSTGWIAAGWLGRLVTVAAMLWLIVQPSLAGESPSLLSLVWSALIGAFLWQGASAAIRAGQARRVVGAVPLRAVLRPVVVVPVHASAARVVAALVERPGAERAVVVDPAGVPVGWVDVPALASVPADQVEGVPVTAVLQRPPTGWMVRATPQDDLTGVVSALAGHVEGESVKDAVLVLDQAGQLVGAVSMADVEGALRSR